MLNVVEIILKKINNLELTKEEIYFMVDGYTKGKIPDYQMSALLMAIRAQGMTSDEIFNLTQAYIDSGEKIDFGKEVVGDKHSTGGVGDKITIVLVPLMNAVGIKVGSLAGYGLGLTGGTMDKLESIKGFSKCLAN